VSAQFRLAEDAVRDLEEAVAYLAEQSETAALHIAEDLEHAFLFIARWPACGHRRPDLTANEDIRFWSSNGYLIAYRSQPRPLLILAVLHGARDAASAIAPGLEGQ
jgi:plasmid stabilization system protein ParE